MVIDFGYDETIGAVKIDQAVGLERMKDDRDRPSAQPATFAYADHLAKLYRPGAPRALCYAERPGRKRDDAQHLPSVPEGHGQRHEEKEEIAPCVITASLQRACAPQLPAQQKCQQRARTDQNLVARAGRVRGYLIQVKVRHQAVLSSA